MIKWLSNLLTRSRQVKNETTDLANTALRVGTLLEDLAKFGISKYDSAAEYEIGQYAVFEGVLAEAVANTAPGESPATAKLKWSLKLVIDPSSITESNNLPVAASAVYAAIQTALANGGSGPIPTANELVKGIVQQATDEEVAAGVNADKYITPKSFKYHIDQFFGGFVKPTIDNVLKSGNFSKEALTTGKHYIVDPGKTSGGTGYAMVNRNTINDEGVNREVIHFDEVDPNSFLNQLINDLAPIPGAITALANILGVEINALVGGKAIITSPLLQGILTRLYRVITKAEKESGTEWGDYWFRDNPDGSRTTEVFWGFINQVEVGFRSGNFSFLLNQFDGGAYINANFLFQPADQRQNQLIAPTYELVADASWQLLPTGQYQLVARPVGSSGNSGSGSGTFGNFEVEQVCYLEEYIQRPIQDFTITGPAQHNTPLEHEMHLPGQYISAHVLNEYNQPDVFVTVSFPDEDHFVISVTDNPSWVGTITLRRKTNTPADLITMLE